MKESKKGNYIILLETATDSCSVALSDGEKLLAEKYSAVPKAHDTILAKLTEEILKEHSLEVSDCKAVAVSSGPGSYMGLRIAASLAKGLAYGAGIPLVGIGTLDVIAQCALDSGIPEKVAAVKDRSCERFTIVPMIDAGRMEVYTAEYSPECEELTEVEAKILTADSYKEELSAGKMIFTGNGAEKFRRMLEEELGATPENAFFAEQIPHASGLRIKAFRAVQKGPEEDCAYFQPFYLKDFIPGKSRKLL